MLLFAQLAGAESSSTAPPQVRFEVGLQLLFESKYAAAARVFEELYASTGSERVRLEWARTAYLLQDYDKAKTLFQAVLATAPPLAVREKIHVFLEDIALAQGRVDYSFSLVRDTNPMAIPSARTFNLFGLPFEYRPQFDSRPKWGANYRLGISKGLDEPRRWIASAGILGTHYGDPAMNKTGFDVHLTYRIQIEPRVELKLSHEELDLGSNPLYRYSWLTLLHVADSPAGWRWSNELRHGGIEYPAYAYQNSVLSSYRFAAEKSVSQFASMGFELGLERGRSVERAYAYAGSSHGLTGTYFSQAIATRLQLKWLTSRRHNAEVDPLFGVLREDRRQSLTLGLEPASFRVAGLTPFFEFGYEKNDSTLTLSVYDRVIASMTLKRSY